MLNVMRERTNSDDHGGFTSIDEVPATLHAFDLVTQAMWWVLPCLECAGSHCETWRPHARTSSR